MTSSKDDLELSTWDLAHTWAADLGLEFAGIELGDLVVYSLLTVLNKISLQDMERMMSDGSQPVPA